MPRKPVRPGLRIGELSILGAALAAPLLPPPWSLALLLALALFWVRLRPPRRELVVAGLVLLSAVGGLALQALVELRTRSTGPWAEREKGEYARVWESLRRRASGAAEALKQRPASPLDVLDPPPGRQQATAGAVQGATLAAFDRLTRLAPVGSGEPLALVLIDRDGNPVAWGGEGLLHEPEVNQWPRSGLSYRASFNSATLFAAEPLDDQRRPWRIVAAASFFAGVLPRELAPGAGREALTQGAGILDRLRRQVASGLDALAPPRPLRWSLVDNPAQTLPGTFELALPGAPTLTIEQLPAPAAAGRGPRWAERLAWAIVAFAFLALTVMRGVGLALPLGATLPGGREHTAWIAALALGGVFAAGKVAELPAVALVALLAGLTLGALGFTAPRRGDSQGDAGAGDGNAGAGRAEWHGRAGAAGAGALLLLSGAAWMVQRRWGPFDVADDLLATARDWSLRLAWSAAAFGLLGIARLASSSGRRGRRLATPEMSEMGEMGETGGGEPWAWIALGLLLGAAALSDWSWFALPLLAAGAACAAVYGERQRTLRGGALATLAVLGTVAASGAWEIAYRLHLAEHAGKQLLARLAPPAAEERRLFDRSVMGHFAASDLAAIVPRSPVGLDPRDLAFALWRRSPLSRPNLLSAVAVQAGGGLVSSFSFGMPLTREGQVDAQRLRALRLPGWEPVEGEVEIRASGARWGSARYWSMPRPGFRAADPRRLEKIRVELLRGGPTAGQVEDLVTPALFALYAAPDGRAALSPWEERPSLPARLRLPEAGPVAVETPAGRARAYVRLQPGRAWEVIYLPYQSLAAALERTGNWGVGMVLLLVCAAPPAALLALPRAAFRDLLRRTVRSYSRRLLLVFTALLLVPLLLLNLVLVRSVEKNMLGGQQTAGQAALRATQELLGSSIRALPVGFVFDPGTFDPSLISISEVVQHEVNLYSRSGLSASSKHELFTSGLLPKRMPGEVYSSLALRDRNLYALANHVGDDAYLELFAPLRVGGDDPRGQAQLFVSVPLLAQQEEAARQLAHLRRHGILATVSLFILLAAVGTRLASNFTRPIMQLVEGTRRIAAGARSLELAPSDLELAALVRAVDEMAERVAGGRERLLREKQVIERMVDNITAGVVSLDRERRVLWLNRVAAKLLGLAVGQSLERVVGSSERLAPVASFLRSAGGEMARATVRLGGSAGEREWSLVWVPVPGEGEPFALLVVEDATEELRGQRLLAWAQMARMIAHEIKNPLTPIRLSAEHMREVYRRDPGHFAGVFERCTANILTQVEELRSIASEFSTYSAIPRIDPRPGDLTAAVAELVEGYRAAPPDGVSVELETPGGAISTRFDQRLLMRAVRNLIENALRASDGGGRVVVRVERQDGAAHIAVLDSGPGVRPELLPRIFEPYFSTYDTGTGLGLPIARRIAEEHGGTITARNRSSGGLEAVITIPA
ncbi:MAG TPA: ATP-binding protein [Thermoanaerobaculia bacterium]|nr:ATP-binding protein [Thermoanaerobaculia bacterium]